MKKLIFFTFNDFLIDGGGRVRMYGILNALAKENKKEIILISNIKDKGKFHSNIKHIYLDLKITSNQKRIFPDLATYYGRGYALGGLKTLNKTILETIPDGEPVE